MRNVPSLETIYRDYTAKGVKFYYLYKALAHPGLNNYVRPHTLEERIMHVTEAKRTLGTQIPWLADNMANDLRHAIGNAPNSEFVLDREGKIVRMRVWSDPRTLRADLEELVGKIDRPTQISELNMKTAPPPRPAPTGIVPRVQRSGSYRPIIAEPQLAKSEHPFYVKLRAEADQDLLRNGAGKLYLGFFVDPIHHVHWNNQVAPVRYELAAKGVSFSPASGSGPEVEEDADADPREFVINVDRGDSTGPVNLKFHYYACSEKWCMPVTQEYSIVWESDRDGGNARSDGAGRGGRGGFGTGRRGGSGGPGGGLTQLFENDIDGDGRLVTNELPERMQQRFDRMDANSDGYVDEAEMQAMRGRGGRGPAGPGGFVSRLMEADADEDGRISRDEAPEPLQQRFDQMDANGDGFIEQRELAGREAGRRPGPR